MAVLRDRPLTHVRSLSMQNLNPFIGLFLHFFLHENSQRGCIRKLGWLKERHTHIQRWERRLQENGVARTVQSYVTSKRKSAPLLALWPVFHAPRWSFGTQSVLVHFLPKMGLRKSRCLKFCHDRPQCVVLHTLVLMYSWWWSILWHSCPKGQTTLSTKSRWRFRTKRRSKDPKESFDHTRLHTFRFLINRLGTVRQSKTRTNVEYRSPAAWLENDEITKRVFLHPLGVSYMMYATLTFSWKLSWRLPWHRTKTWFYTECGLALSRSVGQVVLALWY